MADAPVPVEPLPEGFDALLARVRGARLVLFGEASHGTHEYYRIRERLTRRLIAECGFSFVAVEGDWPDCQRINHSVTGEDGPQPQAALEQFRRWPAWMWANAEVAEFCDWLRAWNLDRPRERRAGFHGLDVYSLWESLEAITEYLRVHDPAGLDAAAAAYGCFEPYGGSPEAYARAVAFVPRGCEPEVVRLLAQARERAARDGAGEFDAWQNAEVIAGAERYYRAMVRGGEDSWNVRDRHMADTLDRLLERYGPGAKGIVWAHNTHVGDARATDMAVAGLFNIGQLARERYGHDDVVLVGFGCHRGEVIAAPRWGAPHQVMAVPPARPGTLEDRLHSTLPDRALLVFAETDRPAWLDRDLDHRAIGVVYNPDIEQWSNYVPTRLGERYDAFVWWDETAPVRPLRTQPARGELETYPTGV